MQEQEAKAYFSKELLAWYRVQKRDLPWRRSRDPYHIWVSEVMLQQTRVETVKPYFKRFVTLFPTVDALAKAPEEKVLKAWEGLGYYSRARNLQSAAREVSERYGGTVPDTKERFSELKGVGPYTAGAVMSIAFNRREPAVDGNVMRVLSRYFCIEEDVAKGGTRAMMERLQYELIPEGEASDFNQAIMELGALVCTPKSPHCLTCPVMERCAGRLEGKEESLPIKTKAKPPRPEYRACALVVSEDGGSVLLRKRPATGLLADMWELPHVEFAAMGWPAAMADAAVGDALAGWLGAELGPEASGAVRPAEPVGVAEHTFSHIHWNLRVHRLTAATAESAPLQEPYRWVDRAGMEVHPLPNVFVRLLKAEGFIPA
ncbi:A/G-specific adenine glycosylase [Paenibacillus antri]|uniref:Adenine DNA glycosylase n=1 Tax=Paenibacillus antri TaxID=2582848 RepID=A0A5R9G8B7_9BACL|nr:A/G-specific adenine glycosylase [Paenibacillus antri]TLS48983.1 A/G-specific adenine glycosylase [Paenibacillus antri]